MRDRVKRFFHSLFRGKLHYFIRFCFLAAFLFLTFKISLVMVDYYLDKLKGYGVYIENLHFHPGTQFAITFDGIEYRNKKIKFHGGKGEVVLDLVESLKEKKPVVERFSLASFSLYLSGDDKKRKVTIPDIYSVPFGVIIKNLHLGRGNVYSRDFSAEFGGIDWGGGRFLFRKTKGRIKGKPFYLTDVAGVLDNDTVKTQPFKFSWDSISLEGEISFSLNLYNADFNGTLSLPKGDVTFTLKKEGEKVTSTGTFALKSLEKRFDFSLESKIKREVDFKGVVSEKGEPFKFSFSGVFDGNEVSVKGSASGDFALDDKISLEGVNVHCDFAGETETLSGFIRGNVRKVFFSGRDFKNLAVTLKLKNSRYLDADLSWHDDGNNGNVKVSGDIVKRNFFVAVAVKGFDLKADPFVASLSPSIKKWIPDVSGNFYLKGEIKDGKVAAADLTFTISRFNFRGFIGKGYLASRTQKGKILVMLKISGDNGIVGFKGYFNPSQVSINGDLYCQNLQLSSFDFLASEGLNGTVTGGGTLFGRLSSLRGNFKYQSKEFSYFGEKFKNISGTLNLDYPSLFIKAKDSEGKLDVRRMVIKFSPAFAIDVAAYVKDFNLSTIERITKRYGVNMPVRLDGNADGSITLSFHRGEKVPFTMDVHIDRYRSFYVLDSTVSGNATGAGEVVFDGKLAVSLSGRSKDAEVAGLKFSGGSYQFKLKGKDISVSGKDFSSPLLDKSSIKFAVDIDTEKQSMNGSFSLNGRKTFPHVVADINLQGEIKGLFDNLTVPVKGKAMISSDYLKNTLFVKFSGSLHEPDNSGDIALFSNKGSIYIKMTGRNLSLNGTLKDLDFGFEKVSGTAGLVVFDLNVRNFDFKHLSGIIEIPILSIFPENLPEIDAVSGVYIKFDEGAIKISDASFSFPGGWFNLNLSFADSVLEGDFKGSISARAAARRFLPFVLVKEGDFNVSGKFRYDKKLSYSVKVETNGVVGRVSYLLGTVKIDKLSLSVENGKLRYIFTAAEVEDGNIVVSGGDVITVSIFNVPVGQMGIWRARITGNLKFANRNLTGTIDISRPVILKLISRKKKISSTFSIPFNVDISLNFLEPLEFKTDVWSIKLLPMLKVTVNNGMPAVSGNFFVLDGKIKYMGKEFVISYGSGIIDNLLELKGNVNIAASSRIGDYYVYMFVRGNLASPVLYFSSEPPLTKEEILSLIMTGATPSEMERSNEIFPVVQVAYYATSTFLKPVEKTFSKLLKLESFSLEPYITRYGETVIKFSVTKKIGDRLRFIGYETTGQDPEFSIGAQYFVGHYKNVYLEYQYSNYYHNEYGIGFNFRIKDWLWLKEKIEKLKK